MITTVTGAPFSGKSDWVREAIRERETAGELGLVMLGWSELYRLLFPGEQSQFRDEVIADTGAPRAVGYLYEVAIAAILTREISGYLVTQSPVIALELADRFDGPLIEVAADVGDVADRAESHMTKLRRTVARAVRSATIPRCRKAAVSYFRESHRLVGRAREVTRTRGGGYKVGEVKRPFDRALWLKGLTPRGQEAVAQLKDLGNDLPDPADVMSYLLRNRQLEA